MRCRQEAYDCGRIEQQCHHQDDVPIVVSTHNFGYVLEGAYNAVPTSLFASARGPGQPAYGQVGKKTP